MHNRVKMLMFLAFTLTVFAMAQPALCHVHTDTITGEPVIQVDKTAPGTKLSGPMTLYYVKTGLDPEGRTIADMYVFLRLRKGSTLHAFSTVIRDVRYAGIDVANQQSEIVAFIAGSVIPVIYQGYAPDYPPFAVKSVDQFLQDDDTLYPGCCNDDSGNVMYFAIMDVVIAVLD